MPMLWTLVDLVAAQEKEKIFGLMTHEEITALLALISIVLGFVSLWLAFKNSNAQAAANAAQATLNTHLGQKSDLERTVATLKDQLQRFRDYAAKTPCIEYLYQDVVLLGPRHSGKTSVAKLWIEPWTDIDGMPHTTVPWNGYEASICSVGEGTRRDPVFGVDINYETVLRIRLHDYPGEDEFRKMAIQSLPHLQSKAVLLLFFDVDFNAQGHSRTTKNNSYYSHAFLESVMAHRGLTTTLAKAIVVFNKRDLLPSDWETEKIIRELRKANQSADDRLNSLFSGMLEYRVVSAWTNQGLLTLLGSAASPGLPEQAKKRFHEHLARLEARTVYGMEDESPEIRRPAP